MTNRSDVQRHFADSRDLLERVAGDGDFLAAVGAIADLRAGKTTVRSLQEYQNG